MKQIFKNRYIKSFVFSSPREADTFIKSQETTNVLSFGDTFGDYQYCYICYNSLTSKKEFVLTFESDENEENLNFLFWDEAHLFVLDTGRNLYLVEDKLNVRVSFEITTPIVGLYLTSGDNLLVLEEASFRLINKEGKIVSSELFDLIEDFSVEGNLLSIHTSDETKIFKLF